MDGVVSKPRGGVCVSVCVCVRERESARVINSQEKRTDGRTADLDADVVLVEGGDEEAGGVPPADFNGLVEDAHQGGHHPVGGWVGGWVFCLFARQTPPPAARNQSVSRRC